MFSRIPNLRIDEMFSCLLLKQGTIFLLRSKNVAKTVYFHKKIHFADVKKNRGFIDSEFVKTCHEHVNQFLAPHLIQQPIPKLNLEFS